MPRTKRNELTAGIFVLGCVAVIIGLIIWVGGLRVGGHFAYVTAPLAVGDVGVVVDSPLKLSTVVVGEVDRVIPSDDWKTFKFRIRMEEPISLRQDALVEVSTPALGGTGSLTVLDVGSPDKPLADADHPIRLIIGANAMVRDIQRELGYGSAERESVRQTIADVSQTVRNLAAISDSLKSQLVAAGGPNMLSAAIDTLGTMHETMASVRDEIDSLRRQLDPTNPDGAMAKVHRTLDNVATGSGDAAAMIAAVRPELEEAADNIGQTAGHLEEYTRRDLPVLLTSLRNGGNELLSLIRDFQKMSSAAREVVTVNNENIHEMIMNLTQVSVNLKSASRDIRRHPWKLLGQPSVSDVRTQNIQNAAEAFAEGAAQLDDAIARLKTLADEPDRAVAGDDPQLRLIQRKISDSFENFTKVEQALWKEIVR